MKRAFCLMLPILLSSCGSPAQYSRECDYYYDLYDEFYTCVKSKLAGDPRPSSVNPIAPPSFNSRNRVALLAYGDLLDSRVRQKLITDSQAKDLFEDKASELQ